MSLLGAYSLFAASCVFLIRSVDVKEEDLVEVAARNPAYGQEFVSISSPLKVHLNSGETVIFPDGAVIRDESVQGLAQWYEVMSNVPADTALVLSFKDVAAVESFNSTINTGASSAGS